MNHSQSLPEPSADALSHSQKLVNAIRQEIENSDGNAISFRRYMEMALYEPELGYYVAGSYKIGKQGDFTTAPEISSLFSKCIANQCAQILQSIDNKQTQKASSNNTNKISSSRAVSETTLERNNDDPLGGVKRVKVGGCLLEFGAGSGRMSCDILLELEQQNQLPERYYILDLSPDLIHRQQQTIKESAPHLYNLVEWVSAPPVNFIGVIVGNEVLDAMPVDVFTQHGDEIYEHHVIWSEDKLIEQLRPANEKLRQQVLALNIQSDAPYTSEFNPNLDAWFKMLSGFIQNGLVLLIDYGYTRNEYYLTERNKGTLICHYQHLVNEAPLKYSGLQDITANVDFTAVAEAADEAGFNVAGFTSQSHFLANAGLETYFMRALEAKEQNDPEHQYHLAQQIRTLSLPAEMGERFKCIALVKDDSNQSNGISTKDELLGFKAFDQRFRL